MKGLIKYFEVNCNMHFEQLEVDFIKERGEHWVMTGIISYKFDLSIMTTLNLYPFT